MPINMPINIKSKFLFLKNRKSKSKTKLKPFTRRIKHKKYTLKKKRKNFRKFGIGYIGGMQQTHDICTICQETIKGNATTQRRQLTCSHVFHPNCIKQWVTTRPPGTCPICRAPTIEPDLIHAAIIAQAEQAAREAQLPQVRRVQQADSSAMIDDLGDATTLRYVPRRITQRPSRLGQSEPRTVLDA